MEVSMIAPSKILVPVDFSACSRDVLDQAIAFAARFGAAVDVLHVWETPYYVVPETAIVQMPDQQERTLAEYAGGEANKRMEDFIGTRAGKVDGASVEVRGRIDSGDPTKIIVNLSSNYDLIVMGTHGRKGLSHVLLGSVAEKVVRRANCPVMTIRGGAARKTPPQRPRYLVPIDFSDASLSTLHFARSLAKEVEADIDVLHVWTLPTMFGPEMVVALKKDGEPKTIGEMARADIDRQMRVALEKFEEDTSVRVRPCLAFGFPADGIIKYAEENDADLIVMAASSRSGLSRVFLGSVAERVVRLAKCPVLTARQLAPKVANDVEK